MAVLWSGTCLEVSGNGCGMFLELIGYGRGMVYDFGDE